MAFGTDRVKIQPNPSPSNASQYAVIPLKDEAKEGTVKPLISDGERSETKSSRYDSKYHNSTTSSDAKQINAALLSLATNTTMARPRLLYSVERHCLLNTHSLEVYYVQMCTKHQMPVLY